MNYELMEDAELIRLCNERDVEVTVSEFGYKWRSLDHEEFDFETIREAMIDALTETE